MKHRAVWIFLLGVLVGIALSALILSPIAASAQQVQDYVRRLQDNDTQRSQKRQWARLLDRLLLRRSGQWFRSITVAFP